VGTTTFSRKVVVPPGLEDVKEISFQASGTGAGAFKFYGFQTPTLPKSAGKNDDYFIQFCRPLDDRAFMPGCGFFVHRQPDTTPVNELFLGANYHPGFIIHNSAPTVNISSLSRRSNVVTVSTTSPHWLVTRAKPGVVIAGVIGCATNPNGAFQITTIPASTQFTYEQTGPDETCTPSTGTAQGGARASIVFRHNDASNQPRHNWVLQTDRLNDRAFEFMIAQDYQDPTDARDRLLFLQVDNFPATAGDGLMMQSRMQGNLENRGFVKSKAFVNDTTGRAAFALERTTGAGGEQIWITNAGTRDIAFGGIRNWSWPYWRFYNDGTARVLTQRSGVDVPTEIASTEGLHARLITLRSSPGVLRFASSSYAGVDAGLSRIGTGQLAVGNGNPADASGELRAAKGTFESLALGGGTPITKVFSTTSTIDFAHTSANSCTESAAITLRGAADGDVVSLGVPNGSVPPGGAFFGYVSAPDTVKVRFCADGTARNPFSGTFRIAVTKF
jgi:hypothetical protein